MTRVISLSASNVKRLKAVRVTPAAKGVTQIVGRNGSGKTSVIDALLYALAGKSAIEGEPLRRGAKRGVVVVETDDLTITRSFTAAGGSTLEVRAKDGTKVAEPQRRLDDLVGSLAFEPLAFSRMQPKAQADLLRQIAGLDFTKADELRRQAYEQRTVVNRQLAAAQASAKSMPRHANAPKTQVSLSDLVAEQTRMMQQQSENDRLRREVEACERQHARAADICDQLRRELAEAQEAVTKAARAHDAAIDAAKDIVDPDMSEIRSRIERAEVDNACVRANEAAAAKQAEADALEAQSSGLTAKIEKIDAKKAELIAAAKFPVPGLGFDSDGAVTIDGLPFANAGGAERLRTSVAIAMALNPKLRACRIDEAGSLDADGMALLDQLAEEHDFQILLTRVDCVDGVGPVVVIEDGEVVGEQGGTDAGTDTARE